MASKGMTFGEELLLWRKECGYSQRKLAGMVGISYTYLSKLEHDKETCSAGLIWSLETALGCPKFELFSHSSHLPLEVIDILGQNPKEWQELIEKHK